MVDVQKAISLIEHLKGRHAVNRWDAALDRYPDLRELLYNIEAQLPGMDVHGEEHASYSLWQHILRLFGQAWNKPVSQPWSILSENPIVLTEVREGLAEAMSQVASMEDLVTRSIVSNNEPSDPAALTGMLNQIQSLLQRLASRLNTDSG